MRTIASDEIYSALRDRDLAGREAADWFAAGFEQAEHGLGTRAGNIVAYCGREALMSLLSLGGVRSGGLAEAVDRVLTEAESLSAEIPRDLSGLIESLAALKTQRTEPQDHRGRLGTLIRELTRRESIELKQDLFDRYLDTLDALNGLVHSGAAARLDDARALLEEAFQIAGRLFAPISRRFDAIDALIVVADPGEGDVEQLVSWNGDPRILGYFFTRVTTPGWFRALSGHEMLRPPRGIGIWPALTYLRALGASEPELVKEWFGQQPRGDALTTQQAYHYLQLARSVQAPIDSELLHVLKGHVANSAILQLLSAYFEERPTTGQDAGATFGLMKHALDGACHEDAFGGGSYILGVLLRRALSLSETSDAERWLGVLCGKTRSLFGSNEPMDSWAIQRLQPISTLHVDSSTHVLEQFVAAIRDVLRVADHAGVAAAARHRKLRNLPRALAGRLLATDLLATTELDVSASLSHIASQLASLEPMPENLALIRRLREADTHGLTATVTTALGTPPTQTEVDSLGDQERIPRRWADVYGWSMALPPNSLGGWEPAVELCRSRWGEPNQNGAVLPPPIATWMPNDSPYPEDELVALAPLDAARRIGAWAPDPAEDFGPNRHGLATVLQKLVEGDNAGWYGPDAREITHALARPVYLLPYFTAAKSAESEALPATMLEAVEEAAALYERDRSNPADYDGPPWSSVITSALSLLRLLDLSDPATQQRAWALIDSVSDPEEDIEPMTQGVYTAVILAAINVSDITAAPDEPPAEFVGLLERSLDVVGPVGAAIRNAIGPNLPWLLARFPTWTEAHWASLIGDHAPGNLGEHTFHAYLERGRPSQSLLQRCPNEIWEAMRTAPATAQVHIMHGQLWEIDGYESDTIVTRLAAVSETAVSDAAAWLGMAAARSPNLNLEPCLRFWESALRARLPAKQYEGFGHFAAAEELDDDAWLDFALPTAQICTPGLALAGENARRGAAHPDDPQALRLVAALLQSKLETWEIWDVARTGLELFRATTAADPAAIAELQERLLECEFYEVRPTDSAEAPTGPGSKVADPELA